MSSKHLKASFQYLKAGFHQLRAVFHYLKAGFHSLKAGLHQLKARFHQLKAGVRQLKARFNQLRADFHQLKAGSTFPLAGSAFQLIEILKSDEVLLTTCLPNTVFRRFWTRIGTCFGAVPGMQMVIFRSKVEEQGQRDRAQSALKFASSFAILNRQLDMVFRSFSTRFCTCV